MRFGELTALQWRDIDEREGKITIERAQWKGVVDSTKTNIVRSVPLSPELKEVLHQHRERMRTDELRRLRRQGAEVIDLSVLKPDDWVFTTRPGVLMHNNGPRRALRACLEAAGITDRMTVHGFRRTFNNLLRQVASDAVVVRSMTGHATPEMTEHYSHVASAEKHKALTNLVHLVRSAGV